MTKEINQNRPTAEESKDICALGSGIDGNRTLIFSLILLLGGVKYIHTQLTGGHEENQKSKISSSTLE